jgi:hypothetical protein
VNGDGLGDLLVGAPQADPGGRIDAGESYVVFGKQGGEAVEIADVQAGQGGFVIRGRADKLHTGFGVSGAGDVNGDGLADVLVGAPNASQVGRYFAGESYVVFGKPGGEAVEIADVQAGQGGFVIRGATGNVRSGSILSGAGDVNGDGFADVLVGTPRASPGGRTYAGESFVVFGKPSGEAVDLSEVQAGRGGFAIRGSAADDRSGSSLSGAGDVNGDGLADLLVGAPNARPDGRRYAGECYVVLGKPSGEAVELSEVQAGQGGFSIRGRAQGNFPNLSVSDAGDVNGDGLADLLIGTRGGAGRFRAGESYVVFGKPSGEAVDLREVQAGRSGFVIRVSAARDGFSPSVSGAGDVNGDGLTDLLIGTPNADPGGRRSAGESYVIFGKTGSAAVELSEIQAGRGGFAVRGSAEGDTSGGSVSGAGDVNRDGLADLLIGAPSARPGRRYFAGESYVVFGKPGGEAVELSEVQAGRGGFVIRGRAVEDFSGSIVSDAGDVNGDGFADVLVGAPRASPSGRSYAGESYVVFGKAGGEAVDLAAVRVDQSWFAIRGSAERDGLGQNISGAGDVNGDGFADVLIGVPRADPGGRGNAGESYVVFGRPGSETVELAEIEAGRGGFAIRGSVRRDYSGSSVSGAGDVNGDGLADVLVGAPVADPGGRGDAGRSYVVFGKRGGEAVELSDLQAGRGGLVIRGIEESDLSGRSVSGAGDVNGDGLADLLIAARLPGAEYPSLSGAAFVVFGRTDAPPRHHFRRGAVRGEEVLNVSDAIRLVGFLFLGDAEPPCLAAADADDSGRLELTDAVRILNYLFLGGEAPPTPGPSTCGQDPTADDLGCAMPTQGCAP